mmetsp:Transcript_60776/g.185587  ORF Transcript_60776/g.185587 Transcript_60776/m.185587 type:complete len:234 (+) Transcript_60776:563-1264(+)
MALASRGLAADDRSRPQAGARAADGVAARRRAGPRDGRRRHADEGLQEPLGPVLGGSPNLGRPRAVGDAPRCAQRKVAKNDNGFGFLPGTRPRVRQHACVQRHASGRHRVGLGCAGAPDLRPRLHRDDGRAESFGLAGQHEHGRDPQAEGRAREDSGGRGVVIVTSQDARRGRGGAAGAGAPGALGGLRVGAAPGLDAPCADGTAAARDLHGVLVHLVEQRPGCPGDGFRDGE